MENANFRAKQPRAAEPGHCGAGGSLESLQLSAAPEHRALERAWTLHRDRDRDGTGSGTGTAEPFTSFTHKFCKFVRNVWEATTTPFQNGFVSPNNCILHSDKRGLCFSSIFLSHSKLSQSAWGPDLRNSPSKSPSVRSAITQQPELQAVLQDHFWISARSGEHSCSHRGPEKAALCPAHTWALSPLFGDLSLGGGIWQTWQATLSSSAGLHLHLLQVKSKEREKLQT